jgi:hypothetical protein
MPRFALWSTQETGTVRISAAVPEPVVDELLEAGRIDVAHTPTRIGDLGPEGRRVQPTKVAWADRRDVPTDVLTARITTWEALP